MSPPSLLRRAFLVAALLAVPVLPADAQRRRPARGVPPGCVDSSAHESGWVRVQGVSMHYLDWRGVGEPLVFVSGAGFTAHVFDDFAPRFRDRHRVVAVTHLGFGESDASPRGYGPVARAAHLVALLDSLGIERATFVGHWRAGEEMTYLASQFPERVRRLIYLDAAWDHTQQRATPEEQAVLDSVDLIAGPRPPLSAADRRSVAAFQEAERRLGLGASPAGEICARYPVNARGEVGPESREQVFREMDSLSVSPTYRLVRAAALVVYARPDAPADEFPWIAGDSARLQLVGPLRARAAAYTRRAGEDVVRAELQGGRIVHLRGGHRMFLTNPDEVEQAMRSFLSQ